VIFAVKKSKPKAKVLGTKLRKKHTVGTNDGGRKCMCMMIAGVICADTSGKGEQTMKEKLIDLLGETVADCMPIECLEEIADHLIANGVTVQEWISVKDRLPEQGQEVIVYSGGVLKPTVFAYQFWNKHYDSWARITHWMPLPEPPKGE
jgi:hypothetical protein